MIYIAKNNSAYERYIPNILQIYKAFFNVDCNIKNPQKFTEKLQWLKIYDTIPLKTYCADKINLRNYCIQCLGEDICPKIYQVYDNVLNINVDTIPQYCIIKCNHGSSYNIVLNNKKITNNELEQLNNWYNTDFSIFFNEFHYKFINRKIFTEELLNITHEYKVWCFDGIPKFTQCIFYDNMQNTLYKNDNKYEKVWSRHDVIVNENFKLIKGWQFNIIRPSYKENTYLKKYYKKYCETEHYNKIINYSKELSKNFKFVRVDFYRTDDDKIYLSELTFTPSAGFINFNSEHTDYQIGQLLKLDI